MRLLRTLIVLALALPVAALAADAAPTKLEPLPEAPPPPGVTDGDPAAEPAVTIIKKGAETIEEYRMGGELYMMKVTPSHGVPYYLVKETADGAWIRRDGPSEQLAVPQWVIFRF